MCRTLRKRESVLVYDIIVEDCHEFFANGALVHNSWREKEHDDMVLAASVALWVGEQQTREFWVR